MKKSKRNVTFQVSEQDRQALQIAAAFAKQSQSSLLRQAVKDIVEEFVPKETRDVIYSQAS